MIRLSLPAFDPSHPASLNFRGVAQAYPEFEANVAFNVRIWVDGFVGNINLPVQRTIPEGQGLQPWEHSIDLPVAALTGGEGWFAIEAIIAVPVYINDVYLDYTPAAAAAGPAAAHFS